MKHKTPIVFMAITTALCMAFGSVGCGETSNGTNNGTQQGGTQQGGNQQGGTQQGGTQQGGTQQGGTQQGGTQQGGGTEHVHNLQKRAAQDPTCTEDGNIEYWECNGCHSLFLDQNGEQPTDQVSVIKQATGHKAKAEWESNRTSHWQVCEACGEQVNKAAHDFNDEDICQTCNYEFTPSVGLDFKLNDDQRSYSVTGMGSCEDTDVVIPAVYGGFPVTAIGDRAFKGCRELTEIAIPNSVTAIGWSAFESCYGLTSIIIPNGVNLIDVAAFLDCRGLTGELKIPNSVTSIGEQAFCRCSGLTSVTIGSGVTSISEDAFLGCLGLKEMHITDLAAWCGIEFGNGWANPLCYTHRLYKDGEEITKLEIPDGVTEIEALAFVDCRGLTGELKIPNSVTSIGEQAFWGCGELTEIKVDENNPVYHAEGNCLIETESKTLILGCKTSVIPTDGSVTSVGEGAFYNCNKLTEITIPDRVREIGDGAFSSCGGLKKVHITDLAAWCDISFGDASANPLLDAEHLFMDGEEITKLEIPNSVTLVKSYAFTGCSGLTEVTIPDSVTSIGRQAFCDCSGLNSIDIPDSVTSIGRYAFKGTAYYNDDNHWTDDVLYIGNRLIEARAKDTISKNYPIRNGTKIIADNAFYDCSGFNSIDIPDSVISIGEYAFSSWWLNTLNFDGTTEAWKAIKKGNGWRANSRIQQVVCSNGTLTGNDIG